MSKQVRILDNVELANRSSETCTKPKSNLSPKNKVLLLAAGVLAVLAVGVLVALAVGAGVMFRHHIGGGAPGQSEGAGEQQGDPIIDPATKLQLLKQVYIMSAARIITIAIATHTHSSLPVIIKYIHSYYYS